jgi:PilZ domain
MSSTNREAHIRQVEGIAGDRRSDRRYDLNLELRWKLIRRRRILETGTGQTIDCSSGGVLFDSGRAMPVGLNVELSIAWPVLLHKTAQLQLVVSGKIIRSVGSRTAIQMTQHEFRTVGISGGRRNAQPARPAIDFFSRHPSDAR